MDKSDSLETKCKEIGARGSSRDFLYKCLKQADVVGPQKEGTKEQVYKENKRRCAMTHLHC